MVVRVAHLKSKGATPLERSGKSSSAASPIKLKTDNEVLNKDNLSNEAVKVGKKDQSALRPPPADSKVTQPVDESR